MYNTNIIPIYEQYSIDDTKFYFHKHKDINANLYNIITKTLKKDVLRITGENVRNIISLFDKYSKTRINISYYNKTFNPIPIPNIIFNKKNYVLFIPIKSNKKNKKILTHLQKYYKVVVLDDLLKDCIDIYEYIIKIIDNAIFVVCPASE
jgi:hypothetical protein